ncbi:LysR family transcriptional regulator [Bhargavaea massiliensis]|uniref:LysR family transcriptional regulator n=1 Tax=Bhargavaea massiliensis TaxID=2697500 RepID=UPI001BCBE80F|nr:LysR family transcriptional regulator [Bhargavaea massiliensis]
MDERDWILIQTLYQEKNITKAAQMLYISQPALTNRLHQLERKLNVKIVNRGRRGVQFTPQGEYLAKEASEMLKSIQRIKENVLNFEDRLTGTLRLAVSNFSTDYLMPSLLKAFKDEYPGIEFKVTTGFSSDITDLIYNHEVHIAIVRGDYAWNGQKHLLFEDTLSIAADREIDIRKLPELPRIDYHTDPVLKHSIDHWWHENFSEPPLVSIEVDKAGTCKKLVANGLGYGILPSMVLRGNDDIHSNVIHTADGNPIVRKTWMLYHEESLELNIVKAFVNFVKESDAMEWLTD